MLYATLLLTSLSHSRDHPHALITTTVSTSASTAMHSSDRASDSRIDSSSSSCSHWSCRIQLQVTRASIQQHCHCTAQFAAAIALSNNGHDKSQGHHCFHHLSNWSSIFGSFVRPNKHCRKDKVVPRPREVPIDLEHNPSTLAMTPHQRKLHERFRAKFEPKTMIVSRSNCLPLMCWMHFLDLDLTHDSGPLSTCY